MSKRRHLEGHRISDPTRRSYGKFMPAWGLYGENGDLVATIRAPNKIAATQQFEIAGMTGKEVKKIYAS